MRTPVFFLLSAFIACGVATNAYAQGTLRFAWQGSVDGGTTWVEDRVAVEDPNAEILVRAQIQWENSPGYALASAAYDVTITGVQNTGMSDQVSNIIKIEPFTSTQQTLAVTRFGSVLKIDDSRDNSPPGAGDRRVVSSQFFEIGGMPFSRDNPVNFFGFTLRLDGSLGTRVVNHIFGETAGGGIITPRLYTTPQGGQTSPMPISIPLEIAVIPAPSAAICFACGSFVLAGRRRRSRAGER
jgi:hypothetical protein